MSSSATADNITLPSPMPSHVDLLPRELLEQVFLFCLPEPFTQNPSPTQAPLLLTQICSAWRAVVISTTSLWANLALHYPSQSQKPWPLMLTWVSRAGSHPISLAVSKNSNPLIDILINHFSYLCKHIVLEVISEPWNLIWDTSLQQIALPLLETFEFRDFAGLTQPHVAKRIATLLRDAPALRHLAWEQPNKSMVSVAHLEWSRITSLVLNLSLDTDDYFYILSHSANTLSHLTVANISLDFAKPLLMPHLRALTVSILGDWTPIFTNLILPSLTTLSITLQNKTRDKWSSTEFSSFLEISGCAIQSFNLHYIPLSEADLIECLHRTQHSLRELSLQADPEPTSSFIGDKVLSLLSGDRQTCLCPKLEVLALYRCLICPTDMLVKSLHSRFLRSSLDDSIVSLKVLEVFHEEDIEEFQSLRQYGLILKVYSDSGSEPYEAMLDVADTIRMNHLLEGGMMYHEGAPSFSRNYM
ncbi:hypothetical protein C8J56DRAFT_491687 [Mycena floridula]|nr:hypothetical protein C8J56DRAFT_491687 [Mycena floridula]